MSDMSLEELVRETRRLVTEAAGKAQKLSLSPETAAALERVQPGPPVPDGGMADVAVADPGEAADCETLDALRELVSTCRKCALCEGRTQTVFADGNPNADLVFVGEAPGEHEDQQGLPFVGRAGQLLTDIIVKGMKMERSDVYICNVIKCRPPNNRDPLPDEKVACEPYLIRQLELVKPKVICALGGHAAKTLLRTDESIGRLRNKWHFYRGIPLRVTYHPAYLLRSPGEKAKTWDDVKEIMKVLRGEVTPEPPPPVHLT